VQFYDAGEVIGEIDLGVQGIPSVGQEPFYEADGVVLLSTGDVVHDQTNIFTIDTVTCQINRVKIDHVAPLNMSAGSGTFFTSGVLNWVAELRAWSPSGDQVGAADYPDATIDASVFYDGHLYSHMVDDLSGDGYIVVSEVPSLAETARAKLADLPLGADAASMAAAGGRIVLPVTLDENEQPDSRLAVIDPETFEVSFVDLAEPLPFEVRSDGGLVYVAHTFMNPGFSDLSDFRHISVVDLATGSVEGHDLAGGVSRIQVAAGRLVALGEKDADVFLVHSYSLPSFEQIESFILTPPESAPDSYPMNLFLPQN
jgi:hypothetical protein